MHHRRGWTSRIRARRAGTRQAWSAALAALVLSVTGASAIGQEYQLEGDEILIRFDEVNGTKLMEFIGMYQALTDKTIHYTKTDVDPIEIRQIGTARLKRADLDLFFGSILRQHEFLLVHMGPTRAGFWSLRKIQPQGGRGAGMLKALAKIVPPSELADLSENPGELVTTSYTTKYMPARDVQNTLQGYLTDSFTEHIRHIENTNTLLMTGFADTLHGFLRLIEEIDKKPDDYYPDVVRRELDHAVAEEIHTTLDELLQAYTGATRQGGGGGARARGGGAAAAGVGPNAEPEPSILAEPRTNSLLVTAGKDTMGRILSWIDDLDIEVAPSGIHTYRLRNSQAAELAETLQTIMDASQQQRGRGAGPPGGGQPGGQGGATATGEQPVTIVPDLHTNSLIISASKTRYAQILEIIRTLDVRPSQVLIQAALVEVSEDLGSSLGVELTGFDASTDDETLFGLANFGLTQLIDTDGDSIPDARGLPDDLARGLTGGIFDPEDFPLPMVLNALGRSTNANVLSLPSILTNDNQQAEITAVDAAPYLTSNQGEATTQTGYGGDTEAGIKLTISPTISADGYLSLSIVLEVSAFTGQAADPTAPPPSQKRTLDAKVTIPDGHTMVIGGVITNDSRRDEEKIPILGDLPLIGFLFRNSSDSANKTNLYFFLTPHIIADDFTILDELTRLHLEEAELLGGKVDMLNRFDVLGEGRREVQELSAELLQQVFEIPSYASVADDAAPRTSGAADASSQEN